MKNWNKSIWWQKKMEQQQKQIEYQLDQAFGIIICMYFFFFLIVTFVGTTCIPTSVFKSNSI
jgi:hypothetical protein